MKPIRMCNLHFSAGLFENYHTGTILDQLLCSYSGLPKGVNYMIIGDPGVGKTTIILDMMANIQELQPNTKILFVSAEMNEIDLAVYVQSFPKFGNIDTLFIESGADEETHNWEELAQIVRQGWDIIAIDSFFELHGIIKEEENITAKKAENMLLSLIKQQNKGLNSRRVNTTFLTIQQVTKRGGFVGSNRLKHSITAMMELRLDNPKNIYSERYITFSKHRRGDVGVKLYYNLATQGNVFFDRERYEQDLNLRHMQNDVSGQLRDFAAKFDKIFNEQKE